MSLDFIAKTSRRLEADGSAQRASAESNGNATTTFVSKVAALQRGARGEMQRSFSHGHCRSGKSISTNSSSNRWNCGIAWKGLDGTGAFANELEDASVHTLGLSALETGEVEPHVFRKLALLCSVRHYAVTQTQLTHPSALRSIFSLLKVGSPRIQRWVMVIVRVRRSCSASSFS